MPRVAASPESTMPCFFISAMLASISASLSGFTRTTVSERRSRSVPSGCASATADSMKRSLLELGGKNALVVYPDADFDAAVDGAVRDMNFTWCGQSCGSTSRVLVHESLHDRFVEALCALLPRRHRPGIATHMDTTMGALVDEAQSVGSARC